MIFIIIVEMSNYHKYITEEEEIRSWFKVTSNRKKVRNIQLWLFEEMKKICKKHNLKYYADWWTLLWAVRHQGFIPWDDDMDIAMFRDDYEKFIKIAKVELPSYMKIRETHTWMIKLVNTNTSAFLADYDWYDVDFCLWIWIDIFPMDFASKYKIINWIKSRILSYLRMIICLKKENWAINKIQWRKKTIALLSLKIFKKINYLHINNIYKKINKLILFKWKDIYSAYLIDRFFPKEIYRTSEEYKFEWTTICVPIWYNTRLTKSYGNYKIPVIFKWWHNCWYAIDKSYKEILKTFDRSKSNEENYKNCKDLFVLE